MLRWRFDIDGSAIHSAFPRRDGAINVHADSGPIIYGPYLEMPAGSCTARILVREGAQGAVDLDLTADFGQRIIAGERVALADLAGRPLELTAEIPEPLSQFEVRLRAVGDVAMQIVGLEIDLEQPPLIAPPDPDRPVGTESRKSYAEKVANGFIARYLSGPDILEVGYRGYVDGNVPIVPQAIGVDVGYPGYNGVRLPFADGSFDAIYSSHCFEHIADYQTVLRDWYRLLKTGGYLIIVVPHQYLFEKRERLPSRTNFDHKRFYTPDSLLAEIRESLPINGYRVRHLADQDTDYNYERPPLDHAEGRFEIEVVLQKIKPPYWNLDDDTVRLYSAGEFLTRGEFMWRGDRPDPFLIEADLSENGTLFTGPHIDLKESRYRVTYYFSIRGDHEIIARAGLKLAVSTNFRTIDQKALSVSDLRNGTAAIDFDVDTKGERFDFGISSEKPVDGKLTFKGVILEHAKP